MDFATNELARFSSLVELIYEGATAPELWTKKILPAVSEYLGAPSCILYTFSHTPQIGGYFFLHGIEQDHVDQYVQKYYNQDVWKIVLEERKLTTTGNILIGDDLLPRSQLLNSIFYKECLSRNKNMVQLMTGIVFGVESTTSLPTTCSFFRGSHHPDFAEADRDNMRLLLPHLSRSLGVMQRLRSAELTVATSLAALDRLPSGVLLLDSLGLVAFANREAQRILQAGDGLRLGPRRSQTNLGELLGETAAASKTIRNAIDATLAVTPYATPHFSKSVTVPHTSCSASYVLQFSALGAHNEFGGDGNTFAAIIFIADGANRVAIDPAALQDIYGLTSTEARVAIALVDHESAKKVAEALNVSTATVRTHIKSIYGKLGVDTRTRFVKLLLAIAKQQG